MTLAYAATALVATGGSSPPAAGCSASWPPRSDFAAARARAYRALGLIGLEGGHYRTDIAVRVAA